MPLATLAWSCAACMHGLVLPRAHVHVHRHVREHAPVRRLVPSPPPAPAHVRIQAIFDWFWDCATAKETTALWICRPRDGGAPADRHRCLRTGQSALHARAHGDEGGPLSTSAPSIAFLTQVLWMPQ